VKKENLITIKNLTFKRGDRIIFDDVSFNIKRGKITAIMGPSGTGKTTLLQLIGGALKPEKGTIHLNNYEVTKLSQKKLFEMRKRIGMLFQSGALFTNLSVFENVAFPLREHTQLPESLIYNLVLMKLESVGLRGARYLMPSELSGGMSRRVSLARAMALDPDLMMYDEPFTGQDPISMGVLIKLIKELNDALGMTSIIVSHDVPETASIADEIYILSEGKIVGSGSPQALENDDNGYVKQFMHGLPDGAVPFHYPANNFEQDILQENKKRRKKMEVTNG